MDMNPRSRPVDCGRGRLISVEGLNGVGKTYLTTQLAAAIADQSPLVLEEFSSRNQGDADLGRAIIGSLYRAADGDPFLRSGHLGAEALALFAVKMFDFERCRTQLAAGRLVLEGRSLHSTAVYQSVVRHSDDEAAYELAQTLLRVAARWRPMPDLTILIVDDVATAIRRAEQRDNRTNSSEQRRMHERAAELYRRLAQDDPSRMPVLDRRVLDPGQIVAAIVALMETATTPCLWEPRNLSHQCPDPCRSAE